MHSIANQQKYPISKACINMEHFIVDEFLQEDNMHRQRTRKNNGSTNIRHFSTEEDGR